jgi:exoribonuclease-2
MLSIAPGAVVLWWEDDALRCGVVVAEEKQRATVLAADGRETRLPLSRLVASVERVEAPGKDAGSRAAAARAAGDAALRLEALSRKVDVPTLWELCAKDGAVPLSEAALAAIAFPRPGEIERAAIVLALKRDGLHFARKTAGWLARSEEHVREIVAGREAEARRVSDRAAVFEALAAAVAGARYAPSGSEAERAVLGALERLAVHDQDAPERDRALAGAALDATKIPGERPAERAFRVLLATGRFTSEHENLAIERYALRTAFPAEVEQAAADAASRGFDRAGRLDLTGLPALTIDSPWTTEIDDALTVEELPGGRLEIGIHIADPASFVARGGDVDVEARHRGTTYYFPEGKLLMMPGTISEDAASLVLGAERPTLSFRVTLDENGEARGVDIARAVVRVAARLDYDDVDHALATGEGPHVAPLRALERASAARERRRLASRAVVLKAPEAEMRVAPTGELLLTRRDQGAPAQRIVSEMMVLAGEVAASWLLSKGAPAIFRRQAAPEYGLPDVDPALPDAVRVRALRRSLRRGETSLAAGPHHGLGLTAYAQVTSPLRRFQDLALHRQILGILAGAGPAYDVPAMQGILAATERAESDGRRAERAAQRYAMLRWLARGIGQTVTGVVVEVAPRTVVTLDETLLDEPVGALVGSALGDRVRLRLERVNPRADVLVLRPA